jgi:hypothetical protein
MNWLNRYADPVYCIVRIPIGLMFACHGGNKILFSAGSIRSGDQSNRAYCWLD